MEESQNAKGSIKAYRRRELNGVNDLRGCTLCAVQRVHKKGCHTQTLQMNNVGDILVHQTLHDSHRFSIGLSLAGVSDCA